MSAALTAACLHMAHALALGLMMSVGYRVKVLWLPRADFKAMIDSKPFKIAQNGSKSLEMAIGAM